MDELLPPGLLDSLSSVLETGGEAIYRQPSDSDAEHRLLVELLQDSGSELARRPCLREIGQHTIMYYSGEGKEYRAFFMISLNEVGAPPDQLPLVDVLEHKDDHTYVLKTFPAATELRKTILQLFEQARANTSNKRKPDERHNGARGTMAKDLAAMAD